MSQRVKARLDRAYRGMVELQEGDRARIVTVPQGGYFNAEDIVRIAWDTKKQKQKEKVRVKTEQGQEVEREIEVERDTGERVGDPIVVDLIARKYERRSYVKIQPEPGALERFMREMSRRGWPVEQLENGEACVAHPKATSIRDAAQTADVRLVFYELELQE